MSRWSKHDAVCLSLMLFGLLAFTLLCIDGKRERAEKVATCSNQGAVYLRDRDGNDWCIVKSSAARLK